MKETHITNRGSNMNATERKDRINSLKRNIKTAEALSRIIRSQTVESRWRDRVKKLQRTLNTLIAEESNA